MAPHLNKLLRRNDANTVPKMEEIESCVADIDKGLQGVKVEEIPILATLENAHVTVLSKRKPNPVIVATPIFEILGSFPLTVGKLKPEVVLCLADHMLSRLSVVENTIEPPQPVREVAQEAKNDLVSYDEDATTDSNNVDYQVNVLTVILLNSLKKLYHWRLSIKNQDTPKFGKVFLASSEGVNIVKVDFRDDVSKNITLECLLPSNPQSDINLPKCFVYFQEIKKKFQAIKHVIICINTDVDVKVLKLLQIQSIGNDSVLHPGDSDSRFYNFKDTFLHCLGSDLKEYSSANSDRNCINDTSIITDENLTTFLTSTQLYCNYPPKVIQQLLSATKFSKNLQTQEIHSEIRTKVIDWYQQGPTEHLNGCDNKAILAEIWRDIRWKRLEEYNVRFKRNPFDFEGTKRIFHILEEESLLNEIGICQSLENHKSELLYISPEYDAEMQANVIENFELPQYIFLVFIASKCSDSFAFKNKLKNCLNKYDYKKVIIVSLESDFIQELEVYDYEVLNKSVGFEDLSKETQRKIMRKKLIIFQDEPVSMEELCTVEYYKEGLKLEIVEKLIKDDNILVGMVSQGLDLQTSQFYLNRQFNKEGECKVFSEEDLCELNDKVVLISGESETGKSTVLTKLGVMLKEKYKHLWVIRIEIKNYMTILRDFFVRNIETMDIRQLLDSNGETKLKNQLEIDVFSMRGKVVLLLDGVSDISPDYQYIDLIISMLVKCQEDNNIEKIFVTARSDLTKLLELEFNIEHFTLSPITEQSILEYLIKYWTYNLKLNETAAEKCKKYGEALLSWTKSYGLRNLFSTFPTQVEMLAYIFMENNTLEWQGCKEYLTANNTQPKLPDKMDKKRFYDYYIERKWSEFINIKNGTIRCLLDEFGECLSFCRKLAVKVILGNDKSEYFSHRQQFSEVLEANLLKTGIVQKSQDDFHFTQKNFAEYFLAESIAMEFPLQDQSFEFKKIFFEEILSKPTFSTTRSFLDGFLGNLLPRYNFKKRPSCPYALDNKYLPNLIHQFAAEGCVGIMRFILQLFGLKTVGKKDVKIYKHDVKIFLRGRLNIDLRFDFHTPLHIASKNGHLEMVKFLVKLGANVDAVYFGGTSLNLAIDRKHYEIVTFLVEQGADIAVEKRYYRSPLFQVINEGLETLAELLFETGMKRRSLRNRCLTLAYAAAYLNKIDILKTFLINGVDVNIRVERDETLLFGAVRGARFEIIEYLVSQGADVNLTNGYGNTVLHTISADSSLNSTAKILIKLGANTNIRNDCGFTPIELAAFGGNVDLIELLLKET